MILLAGCGFRAEVLLFSSVYVKMQLSSIRTALSANGDSFHQIIIYYDNFLLGA